MLLMYLGDEMFEIYQNIITVEEPKLAQVNAAFKAHFAPPIKTVTRRNNS